MQNIESVEGLETDDCLDENAPDLVFFKKFACVFMLKNFLIHIPIIGVLHNNTSVIDKDSTIDFFHA